MRVWPIYLLLILFLALAALFAAVMHDPHNSWFDEVVEWPVLGGPVLVVREMYLEHETPVGLNSPQARMEMGIEPVQGEESSAWVLVDGTSYIAERVWLAEGKALHSEPDRDASVVFRMPVTANVAVLQSADGWREVRYRHWSGWIPDGSSSPRTAGPPLGSGRQPVVAQEARSPSATRLARVRDLLGPEAQSERLGATYEFLTDVDDPELLARLDAVAGQLEAAYRQRYGLDPIGRAKGAVALFASEERYREFQGDDERLAGLAPRAHVGGGVVALYRGDQPTDEVAATLVHELVHLINARALGPALPAWLEEGLADDLATSRIDRRGRVLPGTLGGAETRSGDQVRMTGGLAARVNAARAVAERRAPSIETLVEMSWESFVRASERDLHYALATEWIRYLLEAEDGEYAEPFRNWLGAIADGGRADAEALRRSLGKSWYELDRGFRIWLQFQNEKPRIAVKS